MWKEMYHRKFLSSFRWPAVEIWDTFSQMEEEEHTDRKQQLAAIYQKLNKIKKSLDEGMRKNIPEQGCGIYLFTFVIIHCIHSL